MSNGIYSALSGAVAQATSLDTIASNLANASTTGYRAVRPVFHEVLRGQEKTGDPGVFSALQRTVIDTTPGISVHTEGKLDVRLPEGAFLAVRGDNGERYTRAGDLRVSPEGLLVTRSGHPVLDESEEPIEVGVDSIAHIETDGAVMTDDGAVGQLRIVSFDDPSRLTYEGSVLLARGAGAGAPAPTEVRLVVGELEGSNAAPVRAMTNLMRANRMFEAMQTAIKEFNDIDKRLVTTVPS
jgi:flagellar basal-body rod protein FlgF